jgi:hypothetical protein
MASLTVEVPLSDDAQADPIYSVAAVIEAMADIKILNTNIISPNKFEVFLPASSREHLQTILQEKKILRIPAPLTSQDLLRRASSYNRSRTPTMRQATLERFSTDLQLQVLALAQERVHRLHPSRQASCCVQFTTIERLFSPKIQKRSGLFLSSTSDNPFNVSYT